MVTAPPPLSDYWKRGLDFAHRLPPELFQSGDDVRDTPYVSAVRTAFEDLSLSAVFCTSRVPTVVFRQSDEYDPVEVGRIHAALWNQGLASVFIDLTDDTVRVFSLARIGPGSDEARLHTSLLFEPLAATASTLERLRGLISGAETGRLWHEHSSHFRPQERIDAVLLHNLGAAHNLLQQSELPPGQSAAALIQTMFVAYLEDRQIIDEAYLSNATDGRHQSWSSLLGSGDVAALETLFSTLNSDFNGDLFTAPCSFADTDSDIPLTSDHLSILNRFRVGREKISLTGGSQLRFWGYDFRYIPVELISEVYDRFLRHDSVSGKASGSYYTPMFLADTVVSSVWSALSEERQETARFLDPACGSGIFLVKSFQRLCQYWRERNPSQLEIPWNTLVRFLNRLHGQDINSTAVRITAFSLYLALLEQVQPPALRALFRAGHRLPPLWRETLRHGDFFDDAAPNEHADVVIGNPPWSSRHGSKHTYVQWSKKKGYPIPSREAAWAFMWKALEQLSDRGLLAFLLPAMGFLHNQSPKCIEARIRLFQTARVHVVADLSDLRYQLFANAVRPATIIVVGKPTDVDDVPYQFTYLTPKADLNLRTRRFISLTSRDSVHLRSSDVANDNRLFKRRLWMSGPDASLFNYLSGLPRMAALVQPFGKKRRSAPWRIGLGFQPWKAGVSSGTPIESIAVGNTRYLPVSQFTPLAIDHSSLIPWSSRQTRRRGFNAIFGDSRILVRRGISIREGRLCAAFVEQPLTFQHIIMGISVPPNEKAAGQFITAYLNSRLALWFAFHGTVSFGADRPEINPMDLLQLPLPFPSDLADPDRALEARSELVTLVGDFSADRLASLKSETSVSNVLSEIDRLVYTYFGLNDDEIALVEETVQYTIPSIQPSRGTFPAIWQETHFEERQKYATALQDRLAGWFSNNRAPAVKMVARNSDFAIIELSLRPMSVDVSYGESSATPFSEVLTRLVRALPGSIGRNFMLTPDVRVFANSRLYLVKPLQRRFWLLSAALSDADAIVHDLDYQWHQGGHETSPS